MYSNLNNFWKSLYFIAIPAVWCIIYINTSCFTSYYATNPKIEFGLKHYIFCGVFYYCAIMTLICHTVSMCTDPGTVNYNFLRTIKEKTFCKKCNKERPIRAHHCSTCGICVLKLDHHCPWIFNCVGYYNQKSFFLFLFYGAIGDLLSCIGLALRIIDPSFVQMILHPRRPFNRRGSPVIEILKSMKDPIWIIVGTVLSLSMALAIGGLFVGQFYLILNNLTNVESSIYEKKQHCPFYAYQDKWFMMKTVLGLKSKWRWLIPVMDENKYNGGYKFDTPYPRSKEILKPKEEDKCKCEHEKEKEKSEVDKEKKEEEKKEIIANESKEKKE